MCKVTYQESKGYFVHRKSFKSYEKAMLFVEKIKDNILIGSINIIHNGKVNTIKE